MTLRLRFLPALAALCLALPASAQGVPIGTEPETPAVEEEEPPPPPPRPTVIRPGQPVATARISNGPRKMSGPRTGFTILSPATIDRINESAIFGNEDGEDRISDAFPVITQFGWQFESRLFQTETGLTGLAEWVLLAGGIDRGLFIPSATFLAGLRGPSGLEVGVGPNISPTGAAYAIAAGATTDFGEVSIPFNVALVFGQDGPRASFLVGFTVSDRRW